jgi:hypothetical protein
LNTRIIFGEYSTASNMEGSYEYIE